MVWLVGGGGHAAAAGLRIEEKNVTAFRTAFLEAVAETVGFIELRSGVSRLTQKPTIAQLDFGTVTQLEQLAPLRHG